jgi:hypothetical protein
MDEPVYRPTFEELKHAYELRFEHEWFDALSNDIALLLNYGNFLIEGKHPQASDVEWYLANKDLTEEDIQQIWINELGAQDWTIML